MVWKCTTNVTEQALKAAWNNLHRFMGRSENWHNFITP